MTILKVHKHISRQDISSKCLSHRSIQYDINLQPIILGPKLVGGHVILHFNQWNNGTITKVRMKIERKVVCLIM